MESIKYTLIAAIGKVRPKDAGLSNTNVDNTIATLFTRVYFTAGLIAVVVLVAAGIMFTISAGSPDKVKRARNMAIGAVAGLVVVAMAATITKFVVDGVK